MQSDHLDVCQLTGMPDNGKHVAHGNAKLVLRQPCSNVGMGVRSHIRIQAEGYASRLSLSGGKFVDNFQFRNAFYVEAKNVPIQAQINFPVAFSHTGIHNLIAGEPYTQAGLDLTTADAVGSQTSLADDG